MAILDNFKLIKKYDVSAMLGILESFPQACTDAKRIGEKFELPKRFKKGHNEIVCTGLGGSAIGADLVRSYVADEARIPFFVNRNYTLPNFVGKDTFVIASSYSGNTEETLSAYQDARSRRADIIVITSGGKLKDMAKNDLVPCINIPAGLPPRCALPFSFFPLLILLSKMDIIKDQSSFIDDAINCLTKLKDNKIGVRVRASNNQAKKIAGEIYGRLSFIYAGADHIDSVATRWRGQLAENSKTLASSHLFPELDHNEIVGWKNPKILLKNFVVVMLRDTADHPRISKRMDVTKNILKKYKIKVIEVNSAGSGLLARMFSLIYIGDFVSFYLAVLNKTDPTPVEAITYLKKELAKV